MGFDTDGEPPPHQSKPKQVNLTPKSKQTSTTKYPASVSPDFHIFRTETKIKTKSPTNTNDNHDNDDDIEMINETETETKTDTKTKAGAEAERQTTARPREAQKTLVGKRGAAKADCESPAARDVAGRQTAREEGIGAPAELEGHQ